ncbi:MAG: oligoendopeptidase F, partial [Atribacterota bacterium]
MRQDSKRKNKKISKSQIPGEFRWDIVSLYKSGKEWQKDCSKLDELLNRLSEFKHRFTEESVFFLEVLQLRDEILQLVQKIYTYAHMCKDEDNSNNLYQSFFDQASSLSVKAERSLSFIEPAILSLDYNKLKKWLQDKKNLQVYEHYLEKTCRKKEHTLTAEEEKIVAQTGDMSYMFEYSFELLSYADLSFPKIKDERGRIVPITQSNFSTLLRDKNREVRKRAFKSYYKVYQK